MSSLDYLDLCRLCLVKDRVSVPIFEGEGDVRQIFLKIAACLPVKVAREDKLPKKICDDCVYKVELFYQFWNTTANAEKQLLQWLGEVSLENKQGYVTNVLNQSVMKQEQSSENRLDGNVMQQVGEHQNNMGMGMMDNMGLGIPMIISSANQQQITSVPMDTSGNSVQTVQAVPGPSTQTTHNQIPQNQTSSAQQEDEEESSEDDENSDEECDGDEGLPVKEESEEDPSNRTIEPTTFVNVSLACDEAGPSGLQQQKISDIPEMSIPQPADGDPKSGAPGIVQRYAKSKGNGDKDVYIKAEPTTALSVSSLAGQSRWIPIAVRESHKNVALINTTQKDDNERKRFCVICSLYFCRQRDYKRHMVMHSDLPPYKCETCHLTFKRLSGLAVHKRVHRGIVFTCEICGFATIKKSTLTMHRRKLHERDYSFPCNQCDKFFMSNADLQDHKSCHLETFACDICDKVYSLKSYLKRHKHKMHEAHVPPQFKCDVCNKRFVSGSNLRNHAKVHSQVHQCSYCGKEFANKRNLTAHNRKHTGETPYKCKVCMESFGALSTLTVHELTHTEEKPYLCDLCGKWFTLRSDMMVHRKTHPGSDAIPPPV